MSNSTDKFKQSLASHAYTIGSWGAVGVLLTAASLAFTAGVGEKDAAGQRIHVIGPTSHAGVDPCEMSGVHFVDERHRDIKCAAGTPQAVTQQRAKAAAYIMPAGY